MLSAISLGLTGAASAEPFGMARYGEVEAIPPYEIAAIVRSMGFEPLSRPMRSGPAYVLRAIDPYDIERRVVVDARSGRVVSATQVAAPGYPPRVAPGSAPGMAPDYAARRLPPPSYGRHRRLCALRCARLRTDLLNARPKTATPYRARRTIRRTTRSRARHRMRAPLRRPRRPPPSRRCRGRSPMWRSPAARSRMHRRRRKIQRRKPLPSRRRIPAGPRCRRSRRWTEGRCEQRVVEGGDRHQFAPFAQNKSAPDSRPGRSRDS